MGRSRYKIYEPTHPHFINCTVKRGYVDDASHWCYSSARVYEGKVGLLDIECFW